MRYFLSPIKEQWLKRTIEKGVDKILWYNTNDDLKKWVKRESYYY